MTSAGFIWMTATFSSRSIRLKSLCKGIPERHKQHFLARGVGHYGIFSGRKYREMIYPRIREFIAKHS